MVTITTDSPPKLIGDFAVGKLQKRWDPPLLRPLPPTFLRISLPDGRSESDLPDEQFAIMLQNEEFMNELRWNQVN